MGLAYFFLNAAQAVIVLVWCVFWMSLAIVISLFHANLPLVLARRAWAPFLIRLTGARFVVEPLPNVDWSKPHIFMMNHASQLDICCAFAAIPSNLRFVAKKALAYVPFLGWYMQATKMIFIDRSNHQEAIRSLQLAGERIRAGSNILVYPEGTRSRTGQVLPFKKGPFVLALEAQVSIIPVAIVGSDQVLPAGGFKPRPGVMHMKIGEPIETKGRVSGPGARDALLVEVRDALIAMHRELGGAGGAPEAIADRGVEGVGTLRKRAG